MWPYLEDYTATFGAAGTAVGAVRLRSTRARRSVDRAALVRKQVGLFRFRAVDRTAEIVNDVERIARAGRRQLEDDAAADAVTASAAKCGRAVHCAVGFE